MFPRSTVHERPCPHCDGNGNYLGMEKIPTSWNHGVASRQEALEGLSPCWVERECPVCDGTGIVLIQDQ